MDYSYAYEKLSAARRILMLPHHQGETESIVKALKECSLGIQDMQDDNLDNDARGYATTLRKFIGVSSAENFMNQEKSELSDAVDMLASWLERKIFENGSN